VGKTLVARRLAEALLPEAPLHRHPDYWEDDRRDHLSINEVRLLPDKQPEFHEQSLQAFLALKPAVASRRVALITNVGRLRDETQGILLKTLEEPHPNRVLVLTTPSASPFVVLPTVVSRCQRVDFRPLEDSEVVAVLRREGVVETKAEQLARLARGRPGWALHAAADPGVLERYRSLAKSLDEVIAGSELEAIRLAAELDGAFFAWRSGDREQEDPVTAALAAWQLELRDRMLADPTHAGRWARLLELSFDTIGYLEQNVSPRLSLECFLLACQRPAGELAA
jgi:DNA polymerase-3 subunit delta'